MSGLFSLGEKMGALGDNVANVNTTGFRANEINFEDVLFETTHTGGVRIGQGGTESDFSIEGNIEPSHLSTHMAITGDGFFMVRDAELSDSRYYSRAGEFNFDLDGYLVNPRGLILQGYPFDINGVEGTTLEDIQLPLTTPAPTLFDPDPEPTLIDPARASTRVSMVGNLDSNAQDNSPLGLFSQWDGTSSDPLGIDAYGLRADFEVTEDTGARQPVAVFFDKTSGTNTWEYLITSPTPGGGATSDEGVLARGILNFGSSGSLQDMTIENYNGGAWSAGGPGANGYLTFQTPFSGITDLEFDLGYQYTGSAWQPDTNATTQVAEGSITLWTDADGNDQGGLLTFDVSREGIIRASFDNGNSTDLFRVGLATFDDPVSRLQRQGYTLYLADPDGPDPVIDHPGSSGLGMIMGYSLENSNVDMGEQFGEIILTQRAFQANSKGIVAADEMLKTLMQLKR
jgi:flagellar hook protein FlgE